MGVFPACAGMILNLKNVKVRTVGVPCMRGDDPHIEYTPPTINVCSLHARG